MRTLDVTWGDVIEGDLLAGGLDPPSQWWLVLRKGLSSITLFCLYDYNKSDYQSHELLNWFDVYIVLDARPDSARPDQKEKS